MGAQEPVSASNFLSVKHGYFHNFVRKRTERKEAFVKDHSSAIAKAIASSRSLTSASFRSVLFYDEIMKIALNTTLDTLQ
jgi:hypothetical protein